MAGHRGAVRHPGDLPGSAPMDDFSGFHHILEGLVGRTRRDQELPYRIVGGADRLEPGQIETRAFQPEQLLKAGPGAVDDGHRQAVRRRDVQLVERHHPAGTRVVLDHHGRAQKPFVMRRQHPGIGVIAAAGPEPDDDPHRLALVVSVRRDGRGRRQSGHAKRGRQSRSDGKFRDRGHRRPPPVWLGLKQHNMDGVFRAKGDAEPRDEPRGKFGTPISRFRGWRYPVQGVRQLVAFRHPGALE